MTKPREKTREELQAEIEDGKKKIRQFENREKMLRQKLSKEERRTRSHRLIVRGAVLNLGLQFLAGFLSRFRHGWSLLSVRRHRKRTVDLLGCPDGSIKFSWGYPLKELRSSAPLFISSWIMVAKSFFTLSLSVFAPAFSTYTVLSPNLKVA